MSCYIEVSMTCSMYENIIDYLTFYTEYLNNYSEIEDIVHTIDALEELRHEYSTKQNKEWKEYLERQKLFEDDITIDEKFLFDRIKKILNVYGIKENVETEFHIIMEIINAMSEEDE